MATADTTDIIIDLPPEGLPLRAALALHCPFWPEHHSCEMLRYRMRSGVIHMADLTNSEKLQFVASGRDAWRRVIEWLYGVLENGSWILTAYRSEDLQGEAKPFADAVVRRLSFDKDHDAIRGPNGQLFYGPRIFSATSWKPKSKEPSRTEIVGTVVMRPEGPETAPERRKARDHRPARATTNCTKYLAKLFGDSPDYKTETSAALLETCRNKFGVTEDEYEQARRDAFGRVPHAKAVWAKAGRTRRRS